MNTRIVPIVPTDAMWEAARDNGFEGSQAHFNSDWDAALRASPQVESELYEALQEVISVSDRDTDVYNRAKAALAKAKGVVK